MLKKIKENISDLNLLIKNTNQVITIAGKYGDKIKANLGDIISYKKGLKNLQDFKRKESQKLINRCNYKENSKFYKWVNPKFIVFEGGRYYITSHSESSSRIISPIASSHGYTNQEVISTTDALNSEFSKYGPLLVSFTLKDAQDLGARLIDSDRDNRLFQFDKPTKISVNIENNTERTVDMYMMYKNLLYMLYKEEITVCNYVSMKIFSIIDDNSNRTILSVNYEIDKENNQVIVKSESDNISEDQFKLALLGIVYTNGLFLKKENLMVKRKEDVFDLKSFL